MYVLIRAHCSNQTWFTYCILHFPASLVLSSSTHNTSPWHFPPSGTLSFCRIIAIVKSIKTQFKGQTTAVSIKVAYEFSEARITDYPEHSSLEQQKVLSQFQRPDVWNQGVSRATLPRVSRERIDSLPLSTAGITWLIAASLCALSSHCLLLCVSLFSPVCLAQNSLCLSLLRIYVIAFGGYLDCLGKFLLSGSLTQSPLLPYKVIFRGSGDGDVDISCWGTSLSLLKVVVS